jgi:hypothetical protein
MGLRKIRIANLPPELPDRTLRDIMSKYGDVKDITEAQWSQKYRYSVSNGTRIVELQLKQHIPSHMLIAGQRVLITYEGQPITCYGCNETGHQYGECPHRRTEPSLRQPPHTDPWAQILVNGPRTKRQNEEKRESTEDRGGPLNTNTLGSGKRKVQGEEKGKDEGEGKQSPAMQHIQNMEQELPHDSKNSDTSNQTNDEPMAQEDSEPSQPDTEIHVEPSIMSTKEVKSRRRTGIRHKHGTEKELDRTINHLDECEIHDPDAPLSQ